MTEPVKQFFRSTTPFYELEIESTSVRRRVCSQSDKSIVIEYSQSDNGWLAMVGTYLLADLFGLLQPTDKAIAENAATAIYLESVSLVGNQADTRQAIKRSLLHVIDSIPDVHLHPWRDYLVAIDGTEHTFRLLELDFGWVAVRRIVNAVSVSVAGNGSSPLRFGLRTTAARGPISPH